MGWCIWWSKGFHFEDNEKEGGGETRSKKNVETPFYNKISVKLNEQFEPNHNRIVQKSFKLI